MTPEELKSQLDALKSTLETAATTKAKAETEAQIKALEEKLNVKELEAKVAKMETDAAANQKALDIIIAERKNIPAGPQQVKTFEGALEEKLEGKKANLKGYTNGEGKGFNIEMDRKVVGNMGSSTNLTGSYFVPPTVVPGMVNALYEEVHMRNILPVGSTNSNVIRYVRDNGGEGAPTTVAEAGTKPQVDRDLQIYDANVRKIACYFRVPEEMIEDIPYLSSFLSQIGIEEVMVVEDAQILYGDGTGQNLSGLSTNATAFAAGTSVIGASANQFDVILAAKKQLRVSKVGGPLVGLVSPIDWFNMRTKKDSTNNYIFLGGGNGIDVGMNIDGVQVLEHTAITSGDFFVFSPKAAAIFDRAGTSVRFYDQDQDNAIKNLVTIVIEKRLALPIYRPTAIIKGTFTAAITDLTS